jgi:hypothetical protein
MVAAVVSAAPATIVRIVIARATAMGAAGFHFESFSDRHTFVISHKNA